MMRRYVKKPIVIEAIQWTGENYAEISSFCSLCFLIKETDLKVNTLEGVMNASIGDYIIKGVQGEFYPCKPEIFEMTYDEVTD